MAGQIKQLVFSEGVSVTSPTQSGISAGSLGTYADDAGFVTAKGAVAADGDIYYNTTSDVARYYSDGAWSNIIDDDSAQTLSNKEYDGGTASNTSRILLPKDTTTNLDALTDVEASFAYDTTLSAPVYNNGAGWTEISGGSGGETNFYPNGDADEHTDTSSFVTGNNATFDNGGALAGTFSISTTAGELIDGANVFKYASSGTAGDNDNDFIASEFINIPKGYRGRNLGIKLQYKWEGASGNVVWRVKDSTNGVILTDDSFTFDNYWDPTYGSAKEFTMTFFCPLSCQQIEVGPQVLTGEASVEFIWDEVVVNADPFVYKDLIENQYVHYNTSAGYGSTDTKIPYFTTAVANSGASILSIANDSTNGFVVTALRDCELTFTATSQFAAQAYLGISLNSTQLTTAINGITAANRVAMNLTEAANGSASCTARVKLSAGDIVRPHNEGTAAGASPGRDNIVIVATAETEHVVHHSAGTENTFSARIANNGTATITSQSSPLSPAIASVSRVSAGQVDITFTSGFFSAAPQISGAAEAVSGSMVQVESVSTSAATVQVVDNDGGVADRNFNIIIQRQGTDYKNPNAYAVTTSEQVAYVKDIKAAGTDGGTFTNGSWTARVLNTLEGNTGFVSLSSNQFTLSGGTYVISWKAPYYNVDRNISMMYNVTDSNEDIVGSYGYADPSSGLANCYSFGEGKVTLTALKTFEIRHRSTATKTGNGYGVGDNDLGLPNTFTQVIIRKIA